MTQIASPRPAPPAWRWWASLALGLVVAFVGLVELELYEPAAASQPLDRVVLPLVFGTAVALHRRAPGASLALVWLAGVVQVVDGVAVLAVQLAVVVVAYGAARYGSPLVLWLSGASIPLGCLIAVAYVRLGGSGFAGSGLWRVGSLLPRVYGLTGGGWLPSLALLVAVLAVPALPWVLGLALRATTQARGSRREQVQAEADRALAEQERARAQDTAALRADQARLARDVHDVVGHSLAVILAQAESAQFLPDDDVERMRATMANVASSARQSLRDVRTVLTSTRDAAEPSVAAGDLDELVDGVRGTGEDVVSTVRGSPRPLEADLAVTAYRVLQEMLTNALKHGQRGARIDVERSWGDDELQLVVTNPVGSQEETAGHRGMGLDGMRRRLEAVGGELVITRSGAPEVFTAAARLPLRVLPAAAQAQVHAPEPW